MIGSSGDRVIVFNLAIFARLAPVIRCPDRPIFLGAPALCSSNILDEDIRRRTR
jgi:hypothetical protein